MPADIQQHKIFQLVGVDDNLDALQELLRQNPRLAQIKDFHGDTLLLFAAGKGHLPTVQWLLAKGGASVTERDSNGSTALLLAAYSGHLPTVQWLLATGGASIAERDTDGATALLLAATNGHLATVQWLLTEGGASITERDTSGDTALLFAAIEGYLPTVQWLLTEGGASITERDTDGDTALLWAAYNGHLPTVQWLLAGGGASITERDTDGDTALLLAAANGHLPIIQWLLAEGGASIREQDIHGHTALLMAAYSGQLPTVQWLLAQGGLSITEHNIHGHTALLLAAYNGQLRTVQWLLAEGGASVTERDTQFFTALLWAASNGQLLTVQWLLAEGGASVTEQSAEGDTVLYASAAGGHLSILQWLLTGTHAATYHAIELRKAFVAAVRHKREESALFLYHYGKPLGMSINGIAQQRVLAFEALKKEEIGRMIAVSQATTNGFLPEGLIQIVNAYAFVCLSELERHKLFDFEIVMQRFKDSRNRFQDLGTASLFKKFFAKTPVVPALTIPATTDISAMGEKLFHLEFLMEYTVNPDIPLGRNPINALVKQEITALQQENEALKQAKADTQQHYMFILEAVRVTASLGGIAGIAAIIAAGNLLTGGVMTAFVIAGAAIVIASAYCFFKANKIIHQQNAPLPCPQLGNFI